MWSLYEVISMDHYHFLFCQPAYLFNWGIIPLVKIWNIVLSMYILLKDEVQQLSVSIPIRDMSLDSGSGCDVIQL